MTEQIPFEPTIDFLHVLCRLGTVEMDTADVGTHPDLMSAGGTVKIRIDTQGQRVRLLQGDGRARMASMPDHTYTVQAATGELVNTADGTVGVWLIDPSSPGVDPQGFTYTATVTPTKVGNVTPTPWQVTFNHTSAVAGVVDLAAAASVAASGGTPALDGRVAAIEAEIADHVTWDGTALRDSDGNVISSDGGAPGTTTWAGIADKPTEFPPTAHNHDDRYYTEAEVVAALAGKSDTGHTHAAADLTSGTINPARLGSGTASSSTYLRGDGTWATPEGGASTGDTIPSESALPRALSAAVAGLASAEVAPMVIHFLGSSSVNANVFPARVIKRLTWAYQPGETPMVPILTHSSSGLTVPAAGIYAVNSGAAGASSTNWVSSGALEVAGHIQPRLVIHGIGMNDIMGSRPRGQFKTNLTAGLNAYDAVCTIPPVHMFVWFYSVYADGTKPDTDLYVTSLKELAALDPARRLMLDLGPYADTLGIHQADPYNLDTGDGLHLTDAGSRMWGDLVASAILAAPATNVVGWSAPPPAVADTTNPAWTATLTPGTPGETSVAITASALATDNVAVTGYEVTLDSTAGTPTYGAITPAGSVFTLTGLTADTTYANVAFRAFDAAGNRSDPVAVASFTTAEAAAPDTTDPTVGTLSASNVDHDSADLTVTGAADETALHAQPYRFSSDNGSTYSAWQASNVYAATGLTAETAYQCVHQTRDAAGNTVTGTPITVTTDPAPAGGATITDSFNRAADATGLGATDTGQPWIAVTGVMGINGSNQAYRVSDEAFAVVDFGQADMRVEVKPIGSNSYGVGPVARVSSDGLTFYFVDTANGKAKLGEVINGGAAAFFSGTADFLAGDTLGISAVTSGADVVMRLFVNGVEQVAATRTGAAATMTGTRAGLRPRTFNRAFDDFSVTMPA